MSTTDEIVRQIGEINLTGNIIPHNWYNHVTYETKRGKYTDLLAVHILADIVYWYRPTIVRDEQTGKIIGQKKKFKADKLQKNTYQYSDIFGASKKVICAALNTLKKLNLITIEYRTITLDNKSKLRNVMFIEPVVAELRRITISDVPTISEVPPKWEQPIPPNGSNGTPEMVAYTDITITKNTNTTTTEVVVIDDIVLEVQGKWNLLAVAYNLGRASDKMIGEMHEEIAQRLKDPLFDFDKICEKIKNSKKLRGLGKGNSKATAVSFLSLIRGENYFSDILAGKYDDEVNLIPKTFQEAYGERKAEFCRELKALCKADMDVNIDAEHYYVAVKTWAATVPKKSTDWVSLTMSSFCLKDREKGQLKTVTEVLKKRRNYGI